MMTILHAASSRRWLPVLVGLVLTIAFATSAQAQDQQAPPLADRIPEDAIFYASWGGTDALGDAWEQSHFRGLIDAWPALEELFTMAVEQIAVDAPELDADDVERLLAAAARRPWAIYGGMPSVEEPTEENVERPRFALLIDAGEDADVLADILQRLVETRDEAREDQPRLALERRGEYLVFYPDYLPEPHLARLLGDADAAPPLAEAAAFTEPLETLPITPHAVAWINVEAVRTLLSNLPAEAVDPDMPDFADMLRAFGIAESRYAIYGAGLDGRMWRDTLFLHAPAPRTGALTLLGEEPLPDDVLRQLPRDTEWALGVNLQLSRIGEAMRQFVSFGPGQAEEEFERDIEEMLDEIREVLGVDPRDLAEGFGDHWLAYVDPSTRGMLPAGALVMNWHAQPDRLRDFSDQLANRPLIPEAPGIRIRRQDFRGLDVYSLTVPGVSPAWTITDDRFMFGMPSQALSSRLNFERAQFPRLVDQERFADLDARLGIEDPSYLQYVDLERIVPQLIDAVRMFGASMPAQEFRQIERYLPDVEAIRPHLQPLLSYYGWSDEGFHVDQIGPFPSADSINPTVPLAASIMLPALQRARQEANKIASGSQMRQILISLETWETVHDEPPADLGELAREGFVDTGDIFRHPVSDPPTEPAPVGDPEALAEWINEHSDYVYRRVPMDDARDDEVVLYERREFVRGGMTVGYANGVVEWLAIQDAIRLLREHGEPLPPDLDR